MVEVGNFARQVAPAHHSAFDMIAGFTFAVGFVAWFRVGKHVALETFEAPHEEQVGLDEDVEPSGADHEVCRCEVHLEVLHDVADHDRRTPTDAHPTVHQHLPACLSALFDKSHRSLYVGSNRIDPIVRHSLHVQNINVPTGAFMPK